MEKTVKKPSKDDMDDLIVIDETGDVQEIQSDEVEIVKTVDKKINNGSTGGLPEGLLLDITGDVLSEDLKQTPVGVLEEAPRYDRGFTGILTDLEFSIETGKKLLNDARPTKRCFNCLGDHNITECKEQHNPQNIAANRKAFMNKRGTSLRYHEDVENRFSQLQPGKLSENLRHALGLRHNQLPEFVYRMRVLGYPPGWLHEAEEQRASMACYGSNGQEVSHPDDEDGETDIVTVKYKPEKLVSFPGFNVPVPRGVRDEWREYNYPPMQPHHKREEFEKFMEKHRVQAYKKRKLKKSDTEACVDPTAVVDMEVESAPAEGSSKIVFNPPLPTEPLPPPPPPPPTSLPPEPDLEEGELSEDSQDSISVLEDRRNKILKELGQDSEDSKDGQPSKKSVTISETERCKSSSSSNNSERNYNSDSNSQDSQDNSSDSRATKKRHHRSESKSFVLGATIPESCTPYTVLPQPDLWTVDVSDHILFENLPDALGTWDKMKGLVKKVKERMVDLHSDDEM